MHRYQPRIHLVKWREHGGSILDLDSEEYRTYIFPESVFTAVTAYQNQLVSIIPYFFIPILPVFFLTGKRVKKKKSFRRSFYLIFDRFVQIRWFPFPSLPFLSPSPSPINSLKQTGNNRKWK